MDGTEPGDNMTGTGAATGAATPPEGATSGAEAAAAAPLAGVAATVGLPVQGEGAEDAETTASDWDRGRAPAADAEATVET